MIPQPKPSMTVDEYLAWAEDHPGRYELVDGIIYAMSPETVDHAEVKGAIYLALKAGIRERRLPCRALPDGVTVRVDKMISYEPDALVYCGDRLAPETLVVPNPVVIVEVLSPSTRRIDVARKLGDYFRLPSVMHYLIFEAYRPFVIHHGRGDGETVITRFVHQGTIVLDPPGLELRLDAIYGTV